MPNALTRVADGAPPDSVVRRMRPRLLPTLVAIAAVAVCASAGRWQQERMLAKEALRAQLDAAARTVPVALADLPGDAAWASLRYTQVVAAGEYVASRQVLIDNRVHAGRAGYYVVTPLALNDGRVVLVNRGWIAQGASRSLLPAPIPPAGVVSVRGRLSIPPSSYFELRAESTDGPLRQNLDPARFAATTGFDVLPVVIETLVAPVPDDGLVRLWPVPDYGIETHRMYMVQWYALAMLAIVLWLWFNRPWPARGNDA